MCRNYTGGLDTCGSTLIRKLRYPSLGFQWTRLKVDLNLDKDGVWNGKVDKLSRMYVQVLVISLILRPSMTCN